MSFPASVKSLERKVRSLSVLHFLKRPAVWHLCQDSVNALITDLPRPTTEVARVIGAVAQGDLSQNFDLEVDDRPLKGEFLRQVRP